MYYFTTKTDGMHTLAYEDDACEVVCHVADFREPIWWIGIVRTVSKKSGGPVTLTAATQLEVLQRIELDLGKRHGIKEIYSSVFGVIKYDDVKDLPYESSLI